MQLKKRKKVKEKMMFNTKFFNDFENIKEWTEEEYNRIYRMPVEPPEKDVYLLVL